MSWQFYLNFHRSELERQQTLLKRIWTWYLCPFVPGLIVLSASSMIANPYPQVLPLIFVIGVFWGIAKLNKRAAQRLQHEIEALNAMEREPS
jgi:hypothetical protein